MNSRLSIVEGRWHAHLHCTASMFTRRCRLRDQSRSRLHRWSAQMDLSIKSLGYNALLGQVQVGIAGELGNRDVQISIQFPFRAGSPPEVGMRSVALLEAQQILRAAATVSLPSLLADDVPPPASTVNVSAPLRSRRHRAAA